MSVALSHLVVAERHVAGESQVLQLCLVVEGLQPQRPLVAGSDLARASSAWATA
jgi:hypothetical protein